MCCPERGGEGAVHDVEAGFGGLEVGHLGHAAVQWQCIWTDLDHGLDRLHDLEGVVGVEEAGHVLDADGVGAHLFQQLRLLGVHICRMDRAHRVADGALGVRLPSSRP